MDSWYILDTGSTDGTQDIIRRVMKDYPHAPGKLEEGPFIDFATTRNYALKRSGNRTMWVAVVNSVLSLLLTRYPLSRARHNKFQSSRSSPWFQVQVLH